MSAFAAAVGALFADPNIGRDAVYITDGGAPVLVRVVARRADAVTDFGDARLWSETTRIDLRVAEVPARAREIALDCEAHGLTYAFRSEGQLPVPATAVWIADTFGEMGLWYRLCPVSLIGGSFGPVQGHNPWEAVRLGSAVLHGPETANFAADYSQLEAAGATRLVTDAATLDASLDAPDLRDIAARASALQEAAAGGIITLRDRLLDLMPR